jgi:hypothetical protein
MTSLRKGDTISSLPHGHDLEEIREGGESSSISIPRNSQGGSDFEPAYD